MVINGKIEIEYARNEGPVFWWRLCDFLGGLPGGVRDR